MVRKIMGVAALLRQAIETGGALTEDQLAKLTPEQRASYDAAVAQAAESQPVQASSSAPAGPLGGVAGQVSRGATKYPNAPEPVEDPAEWERLMGRERAARDAAREPYRATTQSPVRISRVATRGQSQAEEVAEHLAATGLAARPELVFGLYRVPDRIRPSAGSEKRRVVEWDVVHAANEPLERAGAAADVYFDAETAWVAREIGAPRVLDEELALAYLQRAGIGPEQTLGIARHCTIDPEGDDESSGGWLWAQVHGVHVFHSEGLGAAALSEMRAAAPTEVASGAPDGVRLEVLDWDAVARAVHPVRQHRPRVPSPFPHLPLTPQELLRSYIEIVGLAPRDSYGMQVTYDRRFDLLGRTSMRTGVRKTTGGVELPCADGKARVRMHGGTQIVLTYRDSPAYVEGRRRWDAYQGEVFEGGDLSYGLQLRRPVPKGKYGRSGARKAFDRVEAIATFLDTDVQNETFIPPRYCWPPVGV
jgi:hypothetical protein